MPKRGLSAAEKKERLKGIFHDGLEPYTLKQIEKLGQKAGVSQMTIKDILGEMVADNEVDMDKIGSTNWYWSFPGKEATALANSEAALAAQLASVRAEKENADETYKALRKERPDTEERRAALAELAKLEAEAAATAKAVQELRENDPARVLEAVKKADICKAGADRWTDNAFALISYLKKKFGKSNKEAMRLLQLKDDFDYVEYNPSRAKKAKTK